MWCDLFYKIFTLDPKYRITLTELKNHPVLKKKDLIKVNSNTVNE